MKNYYGIIYKVTNIKNGKVYIGQTIRTLKKKKDEHIRYASSGSPIYFCRAIRKYGIDSFIWEVIDKAKDDNELNIKEIYWINKFNSIKTKYGYNLSEGGGLSSTKNKRVAKKISLAKIGHIVSADTREKIRNKLIGRKHDEATKLKISISNKGRVFSEETKNKIRLSAIGNKRNLGRKLNLSLEQRKSIAERNRNRIWRTETITKMSLAKKGKPWTEARRKAQYKRK